MRVVKKSKLQGGIEAKKKKLNEREKKTVERPDGWPPQFTEWCTLF